MLISATSAVTGLLSFAAFLTVTWSTTTRRAVIAVMFFSVAVFLAALSTTILSAARDTYARRPPG